MENEMLVWLTGPTTLLVGRVVSDLLDMIAGKMPEGRWRTIVQTLGDVFGYFGAGSVRQ